jgi:uncharacterized membrane protein
MLKVMVAFLDGADASDTSAISMTVNLLFSLVAVVLPYALCLAAVMLTMRLGEPSEKKGQGSGGHPGGAPGGHSRLITAGLCLGIGLGGFFTDILLQQILQWHHMLSSVVPPVTLATERFNLVWDGIRNLMNLIVILTGMMVLFRAAGRRLSMSSRALIGAMLGGWGLFIIVEGVIDHQLFGVHHVRSHPDSLAWDLAYLIFGAALMMIGSMIARRNSETSRPWTGPTPS